MESTLVIIKPNGVSHGLIGEIISRYEKARLSVSALKIIRPLPKEMEGFYAEHVQKEFFTGLVEFMSSGPVVLMVLYGENAVEAARIINGSTSPLEAVPGTIRYDFAQNERRNVVHSSDSLKHAAREIKFWFKGKDLITYPPRSFVCGEQ
jgi:nucleoside-diphosphate kinase